MTPTKLTKEYVDERCEVLDALASTLESRLLSVRYPQSQLDHADALERRAEELIAMAERIREGLQADSGNVRGIQRMMMECIAESYALRYCLQCGLPGQCVESVAKQISERKVR